MATEIQDTSDIRDDHPVMYEELAALEKEFDDVDVEILRKQTLLLAPLYAKRHLLTSRIPHFWPLVLEQAPPDIDAYIQPSDSEVLNSALTNISVERFEVAGAPAAGATGGTARLSANGNGDGSGNGVGTEAEDGDPRSILIRFEFAPNEWFEDEVLEKRFWYRRSRDGWAGLVSEPVGVRWKASRDLTGGVGGAVGRLWEAEKGLRVAKKEGGEAAGKEGRKGLREYRELMEKLETSTPGAQSFFAWWAYRGRDVGAEESRVAKAEEREKRVRAKVGKEAGGDVGGDGKKGLGGLEKDEEEEEEEDLDEDEDEYEYEAFPLGDELAISIAEDLWPGAIKYFTQAQEQDALSEADFEDFSSDDAVRDDVIPTLAGLGGAGEMGGTVRENEDEDEEERRPRKRVRS